MFFYGTIHPMKKSFRKDILNFVKNKYHIAEDHPWAKYPDFAVLRHPDNKKWFGLIGNVAYEKLGLSDDGITDLLNVKTDPIVIGSFIKQDGIMPAYHMNKASWVSILLDGRVPLKDIEFLLNVSFELTKTKNKNKIIKNKRK